MTDILQQRYATEGIDPETKAFALINGKIYTTVAGMEIKAMRSGLLCGKGAVEFQGSQTITDLGGMTREAPIFAVAKYQRFVMDQISEFASDPVNFKEYAKVEWHFAKPYMFLAKIARACALRHAFPDILAGVISKEEIECDLGFNREQGANVAVPAVELKTTLLPPSPKAVSDMVAAIFQKGLVS